MPNTSNDKNAKSSTSDQKSGQKAPAKSSSSTKKTSR